MKLFLIDGSSLFYRAYYAIRSLSNSKGEATNAIYGFITMMRKLIHEGNPDYLAICFDRPEPTFRHEKYKEYKAHRKPMPDDLADQIEPIKEYCRLAHFASFENAGYEADDLLGTLAKKGEKKGLQVFIVTGDKDAMQLVNDKIKILNPHKNNLVIDSKAVAKRFNGLGPEKVVDVMALMGDASDNIPGIPGFGEKTAVKLIKEFGSVENLLKHVGKIKSKSQRTLLEDNAGEAKISKELATIHTSMKVDVKWDDLKVRTEENNGLIDFYKRYEFSSLLRNVIPEGEGEKEDRNYKSITTKKDFDAFLKKLTKQKAFSLDTETTSAEPMRAQLVGLSFCWKPLEAYYIPVSSAHHNGPGLALDEVLEALRPVMENKEQSKYGQNIKYDWMVLRRHGLTVEGINFDTMIASYLINPVKFNHNLDDITLEYLGLKKISTASVIGTGKKQISMADVPLEQITEYACEDADCVFRLKAILEKRLKDHKLTELFEDLELPLSFVLAKMEMNGVKLDLKFLKKLSDEASDDLEKLTQEIYDDAGEEFNINSTKQLSEILFDKLKLPVVKKTKTGYSTDVSVLEKLSGSHDLPKRLLEYRERSKLKSTYLDALPEMVNNETGLIHSSYHQTVTATGRLSSSDPNLQNIPIKNEMGRRIRKAFVPRSEKKSSHVIFSADYSQIELRILAHLSGDKNLTKAFKEDRDIHNFTATLLYDVSEKKVTWEMRNLAKTINFSIIYGKTAYGLSQDLGISIGEADGFIKNYFNRYSQVRDYLDAQKEKARKNGYLQTIVGRLAFFPDINSRNAQIRQFAERAAINAPIQGSAADLIKIAMNQIQARLEAEKLQSLMTMQVHDELVFDVVESEQVALKDLVIEEMEGAFKMRVPLRVDTYTGKSWYKQE